MKTNLIPKTEHDAKFTIPATCVDVIPEKGLHGVSYGWYSDVMYLRLTDIQLGDSGILCYNNGKWSFKKK